MSMQHRRHSCCATPAHYAELHGSGITVTALCPTWVKTGFEAQARKSKDAHAVNHLLFAQNASTVVSRALFMNRMHAAVACCSIPSFCLRIIGKIVPELHHHVGLEPHPPSLKMTNCPVVRHLFV